MKEFANAKMDKWTLFYTILYIFFSIGMVIFMFNTDAPKFALITLGSILSGAFIFAYFMIPKINLSENAIHVKNAFVNFKISIQDISYVEKVEKLGLNIRTFGAGGVFGYFGYFNGNDVWYVTNIKKKVKITMKSGKIYMISPENPDDFFNTISQRSNSLVKEVFL